MGKERGSGGREKESQTVGPQLLDKCRYSGQASDFRERKSDLTETTEMEAEGGTVGEGASNAGWGLAAQLTRSVPQ